MMENSFEKVLAEFEREFIDGKVPVVQDYLQRETNDPKRFFGELLHSDLELRIRNGLPASVESYFAVFSELQENDELVEDLLRTEFQIRRILEPGLNFEKFMTRFPRLQQKLQSELGRTNTSAHNGENGIFNQDGLKRSYSNQHSRFRKDKLYRQGGLGDVWLGQDLELRRSVAIKEIKPKFCSNFAHRNRFFRESSITSRLEHPGIVPIYGVGARDDETPYFAMQFIDGQTFRSAIVDLRSNGTKKAAQPNGIALRRLLHHFVDVCNTVEYAHSQHVVHRDIKPDNIMIGRFGETYLVDWGLAKILEHESNDKRMPATDSVTENHAENKKTKREGSTFGDKIGSPGFMSPEQQAGDIELVGPLSDVYGLGATLQFLISDQPGNESAKIRSAFRPLASVCRKAMSLEPDDRYQSAKAMVEDVENYLSDRLVSAHRESMLEKISRFSRKHRAIMNTALVALTLLSIFSMGAIAWINVEREKAVAATEKAVIAQNSETDKRQRLEIALREKNVAIKNEKEAFGREKDAREFSEQRTSQLTSSIHTLVDVFSAEDALGVGNKLKDVTLVDALANLETRIDKSQKPLLAASIYAIHARHAKASRNLEKSRSLFTHAKKLLSDSGVPETDSFYISMILGQSQTEWMDQNYKEAEKLATRGIELMIKSGPKVTYVEPLFQFAVLKARCLMHREKYDFALQCANQAWALVEKHYPDQLDRAEFLKAKQVAAIIYARMGKDDEATRLFIEINDAMASSDSSHEMRITFRANFAEFLFRSDRLDEARKQQEIAVRESVAILGAAHAKTLQLKLKLATIMIEHQPTSESLERAVNVLEECRKVLVERNEPINESLVKANTFLAVALLRQSKEKQTVRALKLMEQTTQEIYTSESMADERTNAALVWLVRFVYRKHLKDGQAKIVLEQCVDYITKAEGDDSKHLEGLRKDLGVLLGQKLK